MKLYEKYLVGTDERKTLDLSLAVRHKFKQGGLRACLEEFYWIKDKVGDIHPIELNWAQIDMVEEIMAQLDDRGWVRIIILKARQLGMSTLIQGIFFILSLGLKSFPFSMPIEANSPRVSGSSHPNGSYWIISLRW